MINTDYFRNDAAARATRVVEDARDAAKKVYTAFVRETIDGMAVEVVGVVLSCIEKGTDPLTMEWIIQTRLKELVNGVIHANEKMTR